MRDAQPNSPVFFLDRNHGKLIRDLLRRVNLQVFMHKELGWAHDKEDVAIIAECAKRNYVIVSGDKSMERVPEERQAIINGKCKVFMFDDSHKTRTEDWAAAFLVGRQRILNIIDKTKGPLFVTIKPCRNTGHIGLPRFIKGAGGGWLPEGKAAPGATAPGLEHPGGKSHSSRPQQPSLNFPEFPKTP